MSIFYIVGKPRGGKSYQAIRAICGELENKDSKRFIVTNLPLMLDDYERAETKWPKWWEIWLWWLWGKWHKQPKPGPKIVKRLARGLKSYVAEYCPHLTVADLRQRIRKLEDDETGEFWLYEPSWTFKNRKKIKLNSRGTELDVPDFTYEDGSKRGDENVGNPGTLYVIDEVHLFFPARAWQRTGEDATFFLSQHGKFKCDVIMVTQHPDQCDKALRNLAQEYMTVRNLSREPILGFRLGNWFRVNRMLNSPKSPNPYVFDSQFVGMEFEKYGDLYDTSAGVGVAGSLVPNKERRGRSLWWLVPPIAAMLWLFTHPGIIVKPVMAITAKATSMMAKSVTGDYEHPTTNSLGNKFLVPVSIQPKNMTAAEGTAANVTQRNNWSVNEGTNTVYCSGVAQIMGVWYVYLTDGSSYTSEGTELTEIRKTYVAINGVKYKRWTTSQAAKRYNYYTRPDTEQAGMPTESPNIFPKRQIQVVEGEP